MRQTTRIVVSFLMSERDSRIIPTGRQRIPYLLPSYKAVELIQNPAAYTSRTCSACGVVDADSRRSRASFSCVACGHAQYADLNAARSILASATSASARRGAFTWVTPVPCEMDTGCALVPRGAYRTVSIFGTLRTKTTITHETAAGPPSNCMPDQRQPKLRRIPRPIGPTRQPPSRWDSLEEPPACC